MEKHWKCAGILFIVLCVAAWTQPVPCTAETPGIDQQELINELQQMKQDNDGRLRFIWWMAEPFWELELSRELQSEQLKEAMEVFAPYIILGVLDGTVGPFGAFSTVPENLIRENIFIVAGDGTKYAPVTGENTSGDMKNLLVMLKPALANMLGQFGQGLNFIVFPSTDGEGRKIANTREEGRMSVVLSGESFNWRLPLASILPKRTCPKCGEQLKGNYRYCPWDGSEL